MTASSSVRLSRKELAQRAKALLRREISFIHDPRFLAMTLEDVEWPGGEMLINESNDLPPSDRIVPTHLSDLFRHPLLTPEGEQHLFRRMNYLRFLANRVRSKINPDRPRVRLVREVEYLISESESARRQLIESNLRLVASISRKFATSTNDFEELLCEGNAILLYAIDKFDFARGFRFSTYGTHAIQRHFFRLMQRWHRRRRHEVDSSSEMILSMAESPRVIVDPEPVTLSPEMVRHMVALLDDRERIIMCERFGLAGQIGRNSGEKTLKALSEDMGLSKERVRQLQHRALAKLRVFLEERGVMPDEVGF